MRERFYTPEKTVYVDMDGVMADFDAETLRRMRERHPGFQGDLPRTHFYIADDYPEYAAEIRVVCAEEGFFDAFPVIEGAKEGWRRIQEAGWQPRVLSSPLRSNPTSELEKRQWLARELDPLFGPHVSQDAIITKDKHLHDGIALLDDRGEVPHAHEASWSHVVMHYPHNEAVDTDLRLHGMADSRLEEVLEMTYERYVRALGGRAL